MSAKDRYAFLCNLDTIVNSCSDFYYLYSIWNVYGGGRKGKAEDTRAWREEVANDSDKFTDALYAFALCMLSNFDWMEKLKELKSES